MFAFTSIGAKQDTSVNQGYGPYCYRIQGENYHLMGTLLPEQDKQPAFAQLYIYDKANEIQNRINGVRYNKTSNYYIVLDKQFYDMRSKFLYFESTAVTQQRHQEPMHWTIN